MRHRHYIGTICKKRDRSGEKVMRIKEKERKCNVGKNQKKGRVAWKKSQRKSCADERNVKAKFCWEEAAGETGCKEGISMNYQYIHDIIRVQVYTYYGQTK